jgi:hypothetical protein
MNSPETPTSLDKQKETPNDSSVSKKRTYADAFGERNYEMERYGQEIDNDFFETNVGHDVRQ